jgi:hypothetical protein
VERIAAVMGSIVTLKDSLSETDKYWENSGIVYHNKETARESDL